MKERNRIAGVWPISPSNEVQRVHALAMDEARLNRGELERLYERGAFLLDDERYHFLWHLAQLSRTCSALERCAEEALRCSDDIDVDRRRVSDLALRAIDLRQTARSLLARNDRRGRGRDLGSPSQRRPAMA
jgi:hypothetical protein